MGGGISGFLFLFLCIFTGKTSTIIAQDDSLNCMLNSQPSFTCAYSKSADPLILEGYDEPKVYNIFFWGINDDNGNNPTPIDEQMALEAVQNINITFNKLNVYFKYRGYNHFNSSVFDTIVKTGGPSQYTGLIPYAVSQGHKLPNSFNIYIPQHAEGMSGSANYGDNNAIIRFESFLLPTTIHELGHCFGLIHSFSGSSTSNCERVTRDPLDPNYNADEKGDLIIDTPAKDKMWEDIDPIDCSYIGNGDDCGSDLYDIDPEDVKNFMGYGGLRVCADRFTVGQMIRMRETINCDPQGDFNDAEEVTGLASLYEPYKGSYYVSGPFDPSLHTPLFQPGFNYRFVTCDCEADCPEPSPYPDVSFQYTNNSVLTIYKNETNYSSITHPNGTAIQIDFTNPLPDGYGQTVRRCYENYNRAPIGGSITRFNDGVFNNNVTVTPQDSTQINSSSLVDDLQPGLYKVEKNYEDGMEKETIILKEQE